jgi:hypothetical protein
VVIERLITKTHVGKLTPFSQYYVAAHLTDRASTVPNDDDDDDEFSEVLYMIIHCSTTKASFRKQ